MKKERKTLQEKRKTLEGRGRGGRGRGEEGERKRRERKKGLQLNLEHFLPLIRFR